MLSVKFCSYQVRLCSWCKICRRQLSTSSLIMQNGAPVKRKWKTSEIETLLEWRRVTDEVFGPVLQFKSEKTSKTGRESKVKEINNAKLDKPKSVESSLITTSISIIQNASELYYDNSVDTVSSSHVFDDDSLLFLNSNYSETKRVPSMIFEEVSRTEVRSESAKTKQAIVFKNPIHIKDNRDKEDGKPLSSRAELDDTFDYKWEDQPPEKTFSESHLMKDVANSDSANVRDEVLNGVCSESILLTDPQSRIKSESLENFVPLTGKAINSGSSNYTESDKSLPIVQGVKDSLRLNENENFGLSYPLFLTELDKRTLTKHADITVGRVPSVTKILQATQSPESRKVLEKWEKQMIAELGEDGFAKYRADMFANGTNLHTNIELYLTGRSDEIQIREGNEGHWQSIEPLLDCVTGVQYVEHPVRHSGLKYAGIIDCIAEFRGNPCIIEWKTSQRRKANLKSTFDNPLQLAAYLGAYNSQPASFLQLEQCVLVIGYSDGNAADVHVMKRNDCVQYWNAWLMRLQQYHGMSKTTGSRLL